MRNVDKSTGFLTAFAARFDLRPHAAVHTCVCFYCSNLSRNCMWAAGDEKQEINLI